MVKFRARKYVDEVSSCPAFFFFFRIGNMGCKMMSYISNENFSTWDGGCLHVLVQNKNIIGFI